MKNVKKLLALCLSGVLLLMCMSVVTLAEGEETTYMDVDYTNTVTIGTPSVSEISESDPYIDLFLGVWSGYAKGYTVTLEAEKEYLFRAVVSGEGATYVDRALAIMPETLAGDEETDVLSYNADYSYDNTVTAKLIFTPETTGKYKLLVWGYCENASDMFGSGTSVSVSVEEFPAEPTVISVETKEDLLALGDELDKIDSEWVQIDFEKNIDMTGVEYTSISSSKFITDVNGNGRKITGLNAPLFNEAFVLNVHDLSVTADISYDETTEYLESFGIIAGYADEAVFVNCHVSGSLTFSGVFEVNGVGGLIGACADSVYVQMCTSAVDISISDSQYLYDVAGLVGECWSSGENYSGIYNSSWNGKIEILNSSDDVSDVGGIIGYIENNTVVSDCHAEGDITVTFTEDAYFDDYEHAVGGIVGYAEDYNTIEDCSAAIDIDAPQMDCVGGVVGYIDEGNVFMNSYSSGNINGNYDVGGFIGSSYCCGGNTVINCYSVASVNGENYVGGFIGEAYYNDEFINCYASGNIMIINGSGKSLGVFSGYNCEADEENYPDSLPPAFDNCFVAYNFLYPAVGNLETEVEGISYVKFDVLDDSEVVDMTKSLNDFVEKYNNSEYGEYYLKPWFGRNNEGGPRIFSEDYGNVDKKGQVTASDALLALQAAVGKIDLDEEQFLLADVDGSEEITASDALYILQYAVGKIAGFPVYNAQGGDLGE